MKAGKTRPQKQGSLQATLKCECPGCRTPKGWPRIQVISWLTVQAAALGRARILWGLRIVMGSIIVFSVIKGCLRRRRMKLEIITVSRADGLIRDVEDPFKVSHCIGIATHNEIVQQLKLASIAMRLLADGEQSVQRPRKCPWGRKKRSIGLMDHGCGIGSNSSLTWPAQDSLQAIQTSFDLSKPQIKRRRVSTPWC